MARAAPGPDELFELGFRLGPLRGDLAYHFEPVGTSTRISQTMDVRLAGPLAIFNGMLAKEVAKEEAHELELLQRHLESRGG